MRVLFSPGCRLQAAVTVMGAGCKTPCGLKLLQPYVALCVERPFEDLVRGRGRGRRRGSGGGRGRGRVVA